MRKVLILVFVFMTLMGYAQDYPKLKPLKEENLEGKLIPFERRGKYGYKNLEGRVVIRAVFDKAEAFETLMYDRLVARVKCGDLWGLIDRSGTWYMIPSYQYLSAFEKNVAIFANGDGFGLLSHKGTHICEGLQRIDPFDARGYAWVMKDDMWGVINRLGLYMIKPILSDNEPRHLHGTLYTVSGRGNQGVIDFKDFKFLIGLKYDEITMLNNNMLKCTKGTNVSIVTKNGYLIVDGSSSIEKTGASQWKFLQENRWGIFDESGQLVLHPAYDSIKYVMVNGSPAYVLEKDGKYGLSDLYGKKMVPILLETNQFESGSTKKYYEYWCDGKPYGITAGGENYSCKVSMSSLEWPGSGREIQKMKTLGKYLSGNRIPFYVKINRNKEFISRDGFDEYSWARKVSELIAPNSEGKIVQVGLWLDKILKTLDVEKMAEYYCREFQYGLSQAYAALEQTHIEIHLVQNEALGDGKSLVVADLSVSGHHIQRFVSVLNEAGTAIASIRFDGRVYDRIHGVEADGMEITLIDNNIVFTYCRLSDNTSRSYVYTEDLKFQFCSGDWSINQLVSTNDAYYFTVNPAYSSSDILYKVNKGDSDLILLDDDFSGGLTCFRNLVFINDDSTSGHDDKVHKFFTCGKENEVISAVAFGTFIWDGRKVVMVYMKGSEVRSIDYGSHVSMNGVNVSLPKPDMFGLSVYKWQRSGDRPVVRYGLWSEDENCFTLPLFETLEVEGGEVKYTISGKGYKLGIREFLKQYKAAVKLTCAFDERGKVVSQVSDYSDLLGLEEEVVEEEAIPFQLVETKPSFNGGDANTFSKWVNERLVYPEIAKENGVQGRVTLQFTVEKDGRVTKVKVLRGIDPSLDKEAVRVVSMSPKWKPGKQRDRAVPVTYTFPVIFQLR